MATDDQLIALARRLAGQRRVRTPEGARQYGQPVGSVIKPDVAGLKGRRAPTAAPAAPAPAPYKWYPGYEADRALVDSVRTVADMRDPKFQEALNRIGEWKRDNPPPPPPPKLVDYSPPPPPRPAIVLPTKSGKPLKPATPTPGSIAEEDALDEVTVHAKIAFTYKIGARGRKASELEAERVDRGEIPRPDVTRDNFIPGELISELEDHVTSMLWNSGLKQEAGRVEFDFGVEKIPPPPPPAPWAPSLGGSGVMDVPINAADITRRDRL